MKDRIRTKWVSRYLVLVVLFLLAVTISLGYLLIAQSRSSMITLIRTRMLDIVNTAAAMIDGDTLKTVTPQDAGTEGYRTIMRTLTYFQDNMDLKYIYCIRDMGDGTFTFGLDPTVEDPGEFGSPIVYTEALYRASQGVPSADDHPYHDAWGSFYSAYSPVFDSAGGIAGIIAVDFSAQWYSQQLATLTRTTLIVALLALLVGGGTAIAIITRSKRKIGSIQGQLDEMAITLMQEMGKDPSAEKSAKEEGVSMDTLRKRIQSMQSELKTRIKQIHSQANRDEMTGVRSKRAYLEAERELDEKLERGELADFAVVVCDVNGLKNVNDTMGHMAGDDYIRRACRMICDIFAHSPVFRIGGDEFVALLSGRDYENRNLLMQELHRRSSAHIAASEVIVSGGLAEYSPGQDHSIHDVFDRADTAMYREKTLLKSLGAAIREAEPEQAEEEVPVLRLRKHLLIVDDIPDNRELLGDILEDDYDIYSAADGAEALEMLRKYRDEIALVILDLYMPGMTGFDVMKEMQTDEYLMNIPVIVLTSDADAELESLKLGALDFISKPYPDVEIVRARIAKCVELSENRDLIRYTERDRLTGLYNTDYFFRYVIRMDRQYQGTVFDAVFCNINHFHTVNDRYGRQYGDLVLRRMGISIRKLARKVGGIGCRQGGDAFLLYCPHREDYEQLIRKFTADLFVEKETSERISLRFGIFMNAGQEADIRERFIRAQTAADTTVGKTDQVCGIC